MVFVNATIGCGIFLPKTKENTDPSCFPRPLCHALTKSFGRNHFLPIDCGRVLRFMRRLYISNRALPLMFLSPAQE